ncbi:uncharacterized protein BDZ99DRAFT_285906 [Mytilinidion resinicola]|uniref:Uncharacterized protein n=1 Tax=Mytilinidion resinicola TaxID=574789 RepID=A0A6A6YPB6_9PEZI|nr:uncharacterized protein BDZ99DRAFT_285906 [Mytilinidion resinicola]KAF2810620.1 hypothetical protein BDZ99DRAFT_285906 [Mytilinidion resinicola]
MPLKRIRCNFFFFSRSLISSSVPPPNMINQDVPSHYKLEESTTPIYSSPNMANDPTTRAHMLDNLPARSARIDERNKRTKDQATQIDDLLQQVAQLKREKSAATARSAKAYLEKLDGILEVALSRYRRFGEIDC